MRLISFVQFQSMLLHFLILAETPKFQVFCIDRVGKTGDFDKFVTLKLAKKRDYFIKFLKKICLRPEN